MGKKALAAVKKIRFAHAKTAAVALDGATLSAAADLAKDRSGRLAHKQLVAAISDQI
jgi:hypothetical protein